MIATQAAMREAFGHKLVALAERWPELLVVDGDVANSTKTDVFAAAWPERFVQCGIGEQNMIGVAAGLATVGFQPWVSTFTAFLAKRDLDQVRMLVAQNKLDVKLCGAYSGISTGKVGRTHISVQDLAIFRAMPNVVSIAPADAAECEQAMDWMAGSHGPVYLRLTRDPTPVIFGGGPAFEVGRGVVLREGSDVALIGTGTQTPRLIEAADVLRQRGVSAYVLHLATLKPIDVEAILRAAQTTGLVVTSEDHSIIGGLGSAVAEVLAEHIPAGLKRIGLQDVYAESGPNDALIQKYGLSSEHIVAAAEQLLHGHH